MINTRLRAAAVACLLLLALAVPSTAPAAVTGISDQHIASWSSGTRTFFGTFGIGQLRYITRWDVANDPASEAYRALTAWLASATALNKPIMISFDHSDAPYPSVADYSRAVARFHATWPSVTEFTAWNEPNRAESGLNPNADAARAAQYWDALSDVCPSCTVAAGDFSDSPGISTYLNTYKSTIASSSNHTVRTWAIHAYTAANSGDASYFNYFVQNTGTQPIWITEVGAQLCVRSGTTYAYRTMQQQAAAAAIILELSTINGRIARTYYYQLAGGSTQAECTDGIGGYWDTALYGPGDVARPAVATIFPGSNTPGPAPSLATASGRTAFADVTGDGRADAVVANTTLNVTARPSTGSGFLANETWTSDFPFYGDRATFFGDVTGDGKADALAVNAGIPVAVRRSTGAGFAPNETWTDIPFYGNKGTFLADVTGDGKADLVALNDYVGAMVRRSTGAGFSPNEQWTDIPFYGSRGTFLADVTGDGKADLVALNDNAVFIRRSTGSGFSSNEQWTSIPFYGDQATFLADVTGDGKADLVALNAGSPVTVRRSTGGGFSANESWTAGPFSGDLMTRMADVTRDGKADLIAVDAQGPIRVRRAANGGFWSDEVWTDMPFYAQ